MKTARRHLAGTSCRPFSRKGTRLGLLDVETLNLLAWVGLRIELQEADVTQENVEGCATDVFSRFLGPLYWIDKVLCDPTSYGWPVARSRQFLRMRHRVKVLAEISPVATFSKRFWRAIEFAWTDMLCFHKDEFKQKTVIEDEIQKELAWAQGRPNSKAHSQRPLIFGLDSEPFLAALTDTETLHWTAYKARWPGMAGQLNQDSMSPHATHSNKNCLHTLIANCGLIMSDSVSPERWLLASECLLAQGFPVLPGCFGDARRRVGDCNALSLSIFCQCVCVWIRLILWILWTHGYFYFYCFFLNQLPFVMCSFCIGYVCGCFDIIPIADRLCSFNERSPHRNSRIIRQQCGDAMNIQVMSVLHLHSLMCYKWQTPSVLMRSIHVGRKMLDQSVKDAVQSVGGMKRRKLGKVSMQTILSHCRERASLCGPMVPATPMSTPATPMMSASPAATSAKVPSHDENAHALDGGSSAATSSSTMPESSTLRQALVQARRARQMGSK